MVTGVCGGRFRWSARIASGSPEFNTVIMRPIVFKLRFIVAGGLLALAACASDSERSEKALGDTVPAAAQDSAVVAAETTDTVATFAERIVIYVAATPDELAAVKAQMSEEDYFTMADDLMWYRATAHEFLEENGLPVRTVTGKRPLTFVVNGEKKEFDFSGHTTLDVVILYETNREPQGVAPVDLQDAAASYYRLQ